MYKNNKKEPVAIRVDGSLKKGMGHIVRMLSIARELKEHQVPCFFISKPFEEGYTLLQDAGFPVYLIDKDYESHKNGLDIFGRILVHEECRILIHDIQSTTYRYMSQLKRHGVFTVNFDDTGSGAPLADILIDPFVSEKKTAKDIRRFFGMNYLIMRDAFLKNRVKKVRSEVKRICVMPGGTDAGKMMEKVVSWLSVCDREYEIFVMAGAGSYSHENTLYSDHKNSVFMIRDWDAAPDILSRCDISITSGGVSMCESCATGIPTLSVAQVEHENANIFTLSRVTAVLSLGSINDLTKDKFLNTFTKLEKSPRFRQMLCENGRKAVDAMGKKRVVRIIKDFSREVSTTENLFLKVAVN